APGREALRLEDRGPAGGRGLELRRRQARDTRLLGSVGRVRVGSEGKSDRRDGAVDLARGGVLSRAEALRGGETVRSLVPVPLPDALLLRRPGRARRPHGARICRGSSPPARSPNPSREAAERRDLVSRPDSDLMERSISRGAEFYLERKLFEEGRRYAPWFRFHYPTHYYYDVLVGLDVLTVLGYAGDRRLQPALRILREKRQSDGTWFLDRI